MGINPSRMKEFSTELCLYILKHFDKLPSDMRSEITLDQIPLDIRLKLPLKIRLKIAITGQESAIDTVLPPIRRRENASFDDEHPLVFLFLGQRGIGKTQLAKQTALGLNREAENGYIRIDMTEYQEEYEVSKLIGPPPGYAGHEEGGQLTNTLKENPRAVVLFDEIEKAHPNILTILLKLFDEGRLMDGQGNTVQCKDAIFIMNSNLASDEIHEYGVKLNEEAAQAVFYIGSDSDVDSIGSDADLTEASVSGKKITVSQKFKEDVVRPILKKHFQRDEFLGRITEIVYFLPFSRSEVIQLVAKQMEYWKRKTIEKLSVQLSWDRNVLEVLADGYNVREGARSIKHEVERRIVKKLARAQQDGLFSAGCSVKVYTNWPSNPIDRSNARIKLKITESGDRESESDPSN